MDRVNFWDERQIADHIDNIEIFVFHVDSRSYKFELHLRHFRSHILHYLPLLSSNTQKNKT